jgi:hypothetical protein
MGSDAGWQDFLVDLVYFLTCLKVSSRANRSCFGYWYAYCFAYTRYSTPPSHRLKLILRNP